MVRVIDLDKLTVWCSNCQSKIDFIIIFKEWRNGNGYKLDFECGGCDEYGSYGEVRIE